MNRDVTGPPSEEGLARARAEIAAMTAPDYARRPSGTPDGRTDQSTLDWSRLSEVTDAANPGPRTAHEAFIAAWNPQTARQVLDERDELLARLQAVEQERDELRSEYLAYRELRAFVRACIDGTQNGSELAYMHIPSARRMLDGPDRALLSVDGSGPEAATERCGHVHQFNPVVEISCDRERGHSGLHHSEFVEWAGMADYRWDDDGNASIAPEAVD